MRLRGPYESGSTEEEEQFRRVTETPLASYIMQPDDEALTAVKFLDRLSKFTTDWSRGWIFRGQAQGWPLESALHRLVERARKNQGSLSSASVVEHFAVTEFQRRAHHYRATVPVDAHKFEWLALMRHHGAPTRLLDWTRSPYVATFFAIADGEAVGSVTQNGPPAVWAVSSKWLADEARSVWPELSSISDACGVLPGAESSFDRLFFPRSRQQHAVIMPLEPFRLNERVSVQQGVFLCPSSPDWPFETVLKYVCETASEPAPFYRLLIHRSARRELLRLLRMMNITSETLFPGLDGFARSVSEVIETDFGLSGGVIPPLPRF